MRFRTILLIALLLPNCALAQRVACEEPAAITERATELCEELRKQVRVRSSDWNLDECKTELFRRALRERVAASARDSIKTSRRDAERVALVDFDSKFEMQATRAFCGDGIIDAFLGEECDGGANCEDCRTTR